MSNTYLLIGDAQKGPFSEKEVAEMYAARTITDATLHWTEGMSEWRTIGLRDPKTGQPWTTSATIAPPKRTQKSGQSHTFVPVDLKENNLKTEFLSARMMPMTLMRSIVLIGFFFLILTIVIEAVSRFIPDASRQFAKLVGEETKK